MPESSTCDSHTTASKMKLIVWTSTIRPPVCACPARPTRSPGDIMGIGGMASRSASPPSGIMAGKVCMPSTIPVSSKVRNTLSMVLVGEPLVMFGKMKLG